MKDEVKEALKEILKEAEVELEFDTEHGIFDTKSRILTFRLKLDDEVIIEGQGDFPI